MQKKKKRKESDKQEVLNSCCREDVGMINNRIVPIYRNGSNVLWKWN